MARAVISLDRDGTLNIDKGFVHRPADWEFTPSFCARWLNANKNLQKCRQKRLIFFYCDEVRGHDKNGRAQSR